MTIKVPATGANDNQGGYHDENLDPRASLGAFAFAFAGATTADAQQPKRGGTLQFAISAETPHYDCHGSDTYATLHFAAPFYSTLLRFNLSKFPEVEGDLAQSWTVAPDLMTYTFKLHPGVKFHDGTTLTSADVKATYDRLRNPPQGVVSTRKATFGDIGTIETPDANHRRLQDEGGERGDARALRLALELHLCGQGPRRRSQCAEDQDQRHRARSPSSSTSRAATSPARRNDNYFKKGLPYLDGFKGIFTLQAAAMLNALQGGQVLAEFRGISPAERDRLVAGDGRQDPHRGVELDAQPAGRLQRREEAVRRRARAQGAAAWRSTAGAAARRCRRSRRCARSAA